MSEATRLRAFRRLRRGIGERRSHGDLAYMIYVGVLVAAFAGFPVLRAVVLELAEPRLAGLVTSPLALPIIGASVALIAAVTGPMFGPASARAFDWSVLGSGDIRYRLSLRRPMLVSSLALLGFGLATVALVGGAAALSTSTALSASTTQAASAPEILFSALLGAALAVPSIAVIWLAAQLLGARAGLLPIPIVAAVTALILAPEPVNVIALAVLSLAAVAATPWLLDRMPRETVTNQALRVEGALANTVGGDPGLALERLRAQPQTGRRWRAVLPGRTGGGHLVAGYLRRGLIGAARTPARLAFGVLSVAAAGVLLGVGAQTPGMLGAAIAGIAALLAYLGLGTACDGLRHAGVAAVTPAIYGYGPLTGLALHALFPLAMLVLALLPGATITGAGLAAVCLVPILLGLRLIDATEPPMDPAVLAPIPSPVGDLSAITIFLWLTGASTLAVIAGALLVWLPAILVGALGTTLAVFVVVRRAGAGSGGA